MPWVRENRRYGPNQVDWTEALPFVPFPSHTYLADVSLYFMKHLKIQENSRITLCETQPGPNERLIAFGRELGRTFHICPIFLLFLLLSRFFF